MDKEAVLKLLDDLLNEHKNYTQTWVDEFAGMNDKDVHWNDHEEYVERVNEAKEYLKRTL
ncbi:hypothetical protein ACM1RC_26670 [Paenibacillus azoreducens]|uniref:hypothetical protein n=1 Tax=Paenibacillus azoreducens TaxID=116718 RepID=UPI0039F52FC9